jgi:hypothetical protein
MNSEFVNQKILDNLLKELSNLREKSSLSKVFKIVPANIESIKHLNVEGSQLTYKVLDIIENPRVHTFVKICLPCVLYNIKMKEKEIQRVCTIINNEKYSSGIREGLMNSLNSNKENINEYLIERLYERYKDKNMTLSEKVSIAKLLISVDFLSNSISQWLFSILEDTTLPIWVNNINSISIQLSCARILRDRESSHKRIKKVLFNILLHGNFLRDEDGIEWDNVVECLLELKINNNDIYFILTKIEDNNIDILRRVDLAWILVDIESNLDIEIFLIDLLFKNTLDLELKYDISAVFEELILTPTHKMFIKNKLANNTINSELEKILKHIMES